MRWSSLAELLRMPKMLNESNRTFPMSDKRADDAMDGDDVGDGGDRTVYHMKLIDSEATDANAV